MSESRVFRFEWQANGAKHAQEVVAKTYAEACWRLGQEHAGRFIADGKVPEDFLLELDDEQASLDGPMAKSQITEQSVPMLVEALAKSR